jgi:hypothetical protein
VGGWLHGVAYRIALRLRANAASRKDHERQARPMSYPDPLADVERSDLRAALDAALDRLPEKYRTPLVLCYLEGKTHEQAAGELGWPKSTLGRRLEKAKTLLRCRLRGCGVTLPAGVLAAVLVGEATPVPAALLGSTLKAALAVTAGSAAAAGAVSATALAVAEGVLTAMAIPKLKLAVLVLLAVCTVGVGVATHRMQAARDTDEEQAEPEPGAAKEADAPKSEGRPLVGTVVDATGRPVGGAEVWLTCPGSDLEVFTHTQSDARGRFRVMIPNRWLNATFLRQELGLFAYRAGSRPACAPT